MRDPISRDARLTLDLALTIRHEGTGGIADDLTDPAGLTAWVHARPDTLPGTGRCTAGPHGLTAVRDLRTAVRTLFAHAVRPARPGPADTTRPLTVPEALRRLNEAAARTPTVLVLVRDEGGDPVVRRRPDPDGEDRPTAVLATAAIGFLASPERERLRACDAPRCVRYFLKEHPRQEWCKPSCGNRARVARHQERHRRSGQHRRARPNVRTPVRARTMAACRSSAAAVPRPPGPTSTFWPWTRATGPETWAPGCCPPPTEAARVSSCGTTCSAAAAPR